MVGVEVAEFSPSPSRAGANLLANLELPWCAICHEPLFADMVATINCGHVYHSHCMEGWRSTQTHASHVSCPTCRRLTATIKLSYALTADPVTVRKSVQEIKRRNTMMQDNLSLLQRELSAARDECKSATTKLESLRETQSSLMQDLMRSRAEADERKSEVDSLRQWKETNKVAAILGSVLRPMHHIGSSFWTLSLLKFTDSSKSSRCSAPSSQG